MREVLWVQEGEVMAEAPLRIGSHARCDVEIKRLRAALKRAERWARADGDTILDYAQEINRLDRENKRLSKDEVSSS